MVQIVEHDHEWLLAVVKRLAQTRDDDVAQVRPRCHKRCEDGLVEGLDPVERRGDRPDQESRIVVAVIERDPRELPLVRFRPLREDGGLAVTRGRRQQGHRSVARVEQRRYDPVTRDQTSLRGRRRMVASPDPLWSRAHLPSPMPVLTIGLPF